MASFTGLIMQAVWSDCEYCASLAVIEVSKAREACIVYFYPAFWNLRKNKWFLGWPNTPAQMYLIISASHVRAKRTGSCSYIARESACRHPLSLISLCWLFVAYSSFVMGFVFILWFLFDFFPFLFLNTQTLLFLHLFISNYPFCWFIAFGLWRVNFSFYLPGSKSCTCCVK